MTGARTIPSTRATSLGGETASGPWGESRVCIGWGRGEKESSETSEQDSLGAEGLEEEGVWEL